MSIFNLCLRKSIIMPFLVCHKSINNDYTELFLKHKLNKFELHSSICAASSNIYSTSNPISVDVIKT